MIIAILNTLAGLMMFVGGVVLLGLVCYSIVKRYKEQKQAVVAKEKALVTYTEEQYNAVLNIVSQIQQHSAQILKDWEVAVNVSHDTLKRLDKALQQLNVLYRAQGYTEAEIEKEIMEILK